MTARLMAMLEKLTGAYDRDPESLIGKLFSLLAGGLDQVEDTLRVIDLWRDINRAAGRTLDRMGKNFGVPRGQASDLIYRLMIKVKVTALLSGGDVNTVIDATGELFNLSPEGIEVIERFPAKVRVIIDGDGIPADYYAAQAETLGILRRIIAAGVGSEFFFRTRPAVSGRGYIGAAVLPHITLEIPADRESD